MNSNRKELEADMNQYLFNKASAAGIPLGATFELSPMCNFCCKMCYVRKTAEEIKNNGRPMVSYERWLELARELRDSGTLYLLLTGGEPLLWKDFWKLYEELNHMGFVLSINTNGSLIDAQVVERFKKMSPSKVNITLYGASDETYEALCGVKGVFSKVDQAITALQEAGIAVKLNCSLTPENEKDLEQIVTYAKNKGIFLSVATYMFPPMRRDDSMVGVNERFTPKEAAICNLKRYRLQLGEEAYVRYLERLKEGVAEPLGLSEECIECEEGHIQCRAGKASCWITWDGLLTPCGMMNRPVADLNEMTFQEGWKYLKGLCEKITLSGTCEACKNKHICQVCAAVAVTETGEFSGTPQYLCEKIKAAKEFAEEELKKYKKED